MRTRRSDVSAARAPCLRSHPPVAVSWGPGSGNRSLPGLHGPTGQRIKPSRPAQTYGSRRASPRPPPLSPARTSDLWAPGTSFLLGLQGARAQPIPPVAPTPPHSMPAPSDKVQIPEPPPSDTQAGPSHYSVPRTLLLKTEVSACRGAPPSARPYPSAKRRPSGGPGPQRPPASSPRPPPPPRGLPSASPC